MLQWYTIYMKSIVGIDEVGRGPVAGPVAVGAFVSLSDELENHINQFPIQLRDSKKLSHVQREKWFEQVVAWQEKGLCDFCVSMVDAGEIDRHGISKAIKTALAESIFSIECNEDTLVLLDGGLHAPHEFKNQVTIIKGDEKEFVIALASIVAKVTRDRYMAKIAQRYPKYGFERHMGYGTSEHYSAIKKHGLTPLHRKSFLQKVH